MKQSIKYLVRKLISLTPFRIVSFPPIMANTGRKYRYVGSEFHASRHISMIAAAREIQLNHVDGHVAELGVFRGDFAKAINREFPDKEMYLFDTFEGFDNRDVKTELSQSYSKHLQDFTNTSVDFVLKRMPYPEKCRIVKGFFPDSLEKIEGSKNCKYCFVSIDADLFDPIYAGLCYFYPRLEHGGYIFVHDFMDDNYVGAAKAVRKFAAENLAAFCVISDGSAVFAK